MNALQISQAWYNSDAVAQGIANDMRDAIVRTIGWNDNGIALSWNHFVADNGQVESLHGYYREDYVPNTILVVAKVIINFPQFVGYDWNDIGAFAAALADEMGIGGNVYHDWEPSLENPEPPNGWRREELTDELYEPSLNIRTKEWRGLISNNQELLSRDQWSLLTELPKNFTYSKYKFERSFAEFDKRGEECYYLNPWDCYANNIGDMSTDRQASCDPYDCYYYGQC